jgi:hypothetical protein
VATSIVSEISTYFFSVSPTHDWRIHENFSEGAYCTLTDMKGRARVSSLAVGGYESDEEDNKLRIPENTNPYQGLKAFVVGATGRVGRLIVERLVERGVPVRALTHDATAAVRQTETCTFFGIAYEHSGCFLNDGPAFTSFSGAQFMHGWFMRSS